MTEEQYKKVIFLDKRLNELDRVSKMLDNKDIHLSYYKKGYIGHHDSLCNLEDLYPIQDILERHGNIIRLEIKEEMENIKKQISEI